MSGTKRKANDESKTNKKNKPNPDGFLSRLKQSGGVYQEWKKANLLDIALVLPGFREAMNTAYADAMERATPELKKKSETDYSVFKSEFLDGFLLSVNIIQFLLGKKISIPELKYIRKNISSAFMGVGNVSMETIFFGAFQKDFQEKDMTDRFKENFFDYFIGKQEHEKKSNFEDINVELNSSEDIRLSDFKHVDFCVFVESQPGFRRCLLDYFVEMVIAENADYADNDEIKDDFSVLYNEGFDLNLSVEFLARQTQKYFVEDNDNFMYGCQWDTDEDYGKKSMDANYFHAVYNWDEFRTGLMTKISDLLKDEF